MSKIALKYVSQETLDNLFGPLNLLDPAAVPQKLAKQLRERNEVRHNFERKASEILERLTIERLLGQKVSALIEEINLYISFPVVLDSDDIHEGLIANKLDRMVNIQSHLLGLRNRITISRKADFHLKSNEMDKHLSFMRETIQKDENFRVIEVIPCEDFQDGFEQGKLWQLKPKGHPISENKDKSTTARIKFSVLEWSTIFYYADETMLTFKSDIKKERMELFIKDHNLKVKLPHFKAKYYEAKKRINDKNDFPTKKLARLIPYLKEKYPSVVNKVQNDITFLKEETH